MVRRGVLEIGTVQPVGSGCRFVSAPPRPGALLMSIPGKESWPLGQGAPEEIDLAARTGERPLWLFIDDPDLLG
jgi:hypothetical protein